MPVYVYEPTGEGCFLCESQLEILQEVSENALTLCPHCGSEIRRVITRASFKFQADASPDGAAKKGFATYRKLEHGVYEKAGGEGVDIIKQSDFDALDAIDP